jgi:hypothetical protein
MYCFLLQVHVQPYLEFQMQFEKCVKVDIFFNQLGIVPIILHEGVRIDYPNILAIEIIFHLAFRLARIRCFIGTRKKFNLCV